MPRLPIESCSATHARIDGREVLNFAGCNYLGVRGHLEGARLVADSMLSTAIGCASELLAQDRWVVDFFNAGPTWQVRGDELTLRTPTTEIVLAATR